jgi:chromosome segregation ATPase
MVCSNTKASDSTQRVLHYLESLKDVEIEREGTHSSFDASNLWFSLLTLWFLGLVALTVELATSKKVLSEEKASWSATDRSLAEEKAAHQTTEQPLQTLNEARANLEQDLESVQASFTTTASKLASKLSALDVAVVQEHKMEIQLKAAEEKLKAAEEKMKTQGQLLDLAQ